MASIEITPASAVGGTTFAVTGSGFGKGQRLKMTVDGVGSTTNRFRAERNGAFVVGVTTGTASSLGTHTVKILNDSNSTLLATGTFQVVAVNPEPEPEPPPPTGTPNVPASIDKTGATDVSAALNAWIASQPDGAKIVFPAGGIYRMNGNGIVLTGRKGLQFFGNGSEIKTYGPPDQHRSTPFALWGADEHILIDGFKLTPNGSGLYKYGGPYEAHHGICVFGGKFIEIRNNVIRNTWGDGIYLPGSRPDNTTHIWCEDVNIHHNDFALVGRMGVAIIAARRTTITNNKFDKMSLDILDIEPDMTGQGCDGVLFKDNEIGSYGHSDLYNSNILAITSGSPISSSAPIPVNNVTVDGNVVTTGRAVNSKNTKAGVTCRVWDKGGRWKNIRFTNNRSSVVGPQYSLGFEAVDGLVVTGNQQPVSAQPLAYISTDCTNVTKDV